MVFLKAMQTLVFIALTCTYSLYRRFTCASRDRDLPGSTSAFALKSGFAARVYLLGNLDIDELCSKVTVVV